MIGGYELGSPFLFLGLCYYDENKIIVMDAFLVAPGLASSKQKIGMRDSCGQDGARVNFKIKRNYPINVDNLT